MALVDGALAIQGCSRYRIVGDGWCAWNVRNRVRAGQGTRGQRSNDRWRGPYDDQRNDYCLP